MRFSSFIFLAIVLAVFNHESKAQQIQFSNYWVVSDYQLTIMMGTKRLYVPAKWKYPLNPFERFDLYGVGTYFDVGGFQRSEFKCTGGRVDQQYINGARGTPFTCKTRDYMRACHCWFQPGGSVVVPPDPPNQQGCITNGGRCDHAANKAKCPGIFEASYDCPFGTQCCRPPKKDNVSKKQKEKTDTVPSVCGKPVKSRRIIGGRPAASKAWPWQVSLKLRHQRVPSILIHSCGGSIIDRKWILTAAHCVHGGIVRSPNDVMVRIGEIHQVDRSNNEVDFEVQRVIIHKGYTGNHMQVGPNDIALLQLKRSIVYTEYASPVCLPNPGEFFADGRSCTNTGWGNTEGTGSSLKLNQATAPVLDKSTCARQYPQLYGLIYNTRTVVCFGNGRQGACKGDSGGPLVCKRPTDGSWVEAGVVSGGANTCHGQPGVFTDTTLYLKWIADNISRYGK